MQQIVADVVAMIAVVNRGSRKSGSVNSFTKFCSVGFRALSVKAYTASHDIGITISAIMTAANSHNTGLVQSILALMGVVSVAMVILSFYLSFRGAQRTSGSQLRIGESRDSGFDASHRPGMTTTNWFGQGRRHTRNNFAYFVLISSVIA